MIALLNFIRDAAADILGYDSAAEIDPDASFADIGFESLAAVELAARLSDEVGFEVPLTAGFDHPTPRALAAHLAELGGEPAPAEEPAESLDAAEPIAIVGMSCRYPGGVGSPEDLWRLVAQGIDGTSPFPADRGWDLERIYDPDPAHLGTTYTRRGGFLADADAFDAQFFGLSEREALAMDPQQRLVLEAAWTAL